MARIDDLLVAEAHRTEADASEIGKTFRPLQIEAMELWHRMQAEDPGVDLGDDILFEGEDLSDFDANVPATSHR